MKNFCVLLLLSIAILFADRASAADLVADIRAKLADPSKPLTLIVELPIDDALATEFKTVVQKVQANEPRTKLYTALRETGAKQGVTVVETYADIDAFAAHLAQPYIKAFIAKLEAAKVEAKIRVMEELR